MDKTCYVLLVLIFLAMFGSGLFLGLAFPMPRPGDDFKPITPPLHEPEHSNVPAHKCSALHTNNSDAKTREFRNAMCEPPKQESAYNCACFTQLKLCAIPKAEHIKFSLVCDRHNTKINLAQHIRTSCAKCSVIDRKLKEISMSVDYRLCPTLEEIQDKTIAQVEALIHDESHLKGHLRLIGLNKKAQTVQPWIEAAHNFGRDLYNPAPAGQITAESIIPRTSLEPPRYKDVGCCTSSPSEQVIANIASARPSFAQKCGSLIGRINNGFRNGINYLFMRKASRANNQQPAVVNKSAAPAKLDTVMQTVDKSDNGTVVEVDNVLGKSPVNNLDQMHGQSDACDIAGSSPASDSVLKNQKLQQVPRSEIDKSKNPVKASDNASRNQKLQQGPRSEKDKSNNSVKVSDNASRNQKLQQDPRSEKDKSKNPVKASDNASMNQKPQQVPRSEKDKSNNLVKACIVSPEAVQVIKSNSKMPGSMLPSRSTEIEISELPDGHGQQLSAEQICDNVATKYIVETPCDVEGEIACHGTPNITKVIPATNTAKDSYIRCH